MKASISRALSIINTHRRSVCCSCSSGMQHWWLDSFFLFFKHTHWPYVLSFDPIIIYDLHIIIIIIPPQAPDWWLAEPAFGLQAPVLGSQQFIRHVKCQINQDHWVWAAWDESHLQLEPLACHWHRWDSLRFCTEAGTRCLSMASSTSLLGTNAIPNLIIFLESSSQRTDVDVQKVKWTNSFFHLNIVHKITYFITKWLLVSTD